MTQATQDTEVLMSGAELRAAREFLGLSPFWMGKYLGCRERGITDAETGVTSVGPRWQEKVYRLLEEADELAEKLITDCGAELRRNPDAPTCMLLTYATDRDTRLPSIDGLRYPARWHRHICSRVVYEVEGVSIAYDPEKAEEAPPPATQLDRVVAMCTKAEESGGTVDPKVILELIQG